MHVALIASGVAAEEIEVLTAFNIPYIDALTAVDCDGEACVVVTNFCQVKVDE